MPHFRLGEAEHGVEFGPQADVGTDVEPAGHVVQRDGGYAGDEQTLQTAAFACARLQRREEVAVEAAAVRERVVRLGAAGGEDGVGEVVVFVDEDQERDVPVAGVGEQFAEFAVDGRVREDVLDRLLAEQVPIPPQGVPQHDFAIALEAFPQGFQGVVEFREVEAQDDVAVTVSGRPVPDVRAAEDGLELVASLATVVVLHQRHPAGFAEASGPDEKSVGLVLQCTQKAGLVDVEPAAQADAPEVRLAVGDAWVGSGHCVVPGRMLHGIMARIAVPGQRRFRIFVRRGPEPDRSG